MTERNEKLLQILKGDVKPAMGCTGPISVVFAAAAAAKAIGGTPAHLHLLMDKDTYKNSISVATPGTPYMGVLEPGVVGAFYGNADYGLEVIKDLGDDWDQALVEEFAQKHTTIEIRWEQKYMSVYVEAVVETENGTGRAVVARTHDGLVLLERNGQIVYRDESYTDDALFEQAKPIRAFGVQDLCEFALHTEIENLYFLRDALKLNYALAQAGLERNCGAKFGNGILQYDSSAFARCKALAAAASDARMSGVALSAMSCGGSGNVGITASVPLMELAKARNVSEPMLLRGLALSYLLCILGKAHIGRLSPICACSLVASMGVAAGACLMLGGTQQQIDTAVSNLIGSVGGVFCDGAKYGCALKLASCVGVGLDCAMLALQSIAIPAGDGVVGANADESLQLIGTLASPGMLYEDELLCRALMDRETKRH